MGEALLQITEWAFRKLFKIKRSKWQIMMAAAPTNALLWNDLNGLLNEISILLAADYRCRSSLVEMTSGTSSWCRTIAPFPQESPESRLKSRLKSRPAPSRVNMNQWEFNTRFNHRQCAVKYSVCDLTNPYYLRMLDDVSRSRWVCILMIRCCNISCCVL